LTAQSYTASAPLSLGGCIKQLRGIPISPYPRYQNIETLKEWYMPLTPRSIKFGVKYLQLLHQYLHQAATKSGYTVLVILRLLKAFYAKRRSREILGRYVPDAPGFRCMARVELHAWDSRIFPGLVKRVLRCMMSLHYQNLSSPEKGFEITITVTIAHRDDYLSKR
jgi:hypothetical protein